jgi:hypothetical protein
MENLEPSIIMCICEVLAISMSSRHVARLCPLPVHKRFLLSLAVGPSAVY